MHKILKGNSNLVILFLCIGLLLTNHFAAFHGHFGYDDLMYARLSASILEGNFLLNDYHFTYRWTILFFTAFSYYLFGISDLASSIPPLLVSILTMFIVYKASKNLSPEIFIFIMALFFLNPWTLYYSDKLMPDIYVAFAGIGLVATIYFHRYKNNNSKDFIYALVFSLFVLFGIVSKAAILLLMPICLFVLLSDILQKKHIQFWILSSLFLGVLIGFYLLVIKGFTGNYLQRIIAIDTSNFYNISSYEQHSLLKLLERITIGLPLLFTKTHMIMGLVFSVPAICSINFKRLVSISDEAAFFPLITLLAYLSANFMSTSFKHYIPMHSDPRHYLFLIPIAAITAGPVILGFITQKNHKNTILVLSGVLAIMSCIVNSNGAMNTYIPLFIVVLFRYLMPAKDDLLRQNFIITLFLGVILIKPVSLFLSDADTIYNNQKEIIKNHIIGKGENCIVITNPVQKHLGEYYLGFKKTGAPLFLSYEQAKDFNFNPTQNLFLLTNPQTRNLSVMNHYRLPLYARNVAHDIIKLASKGNVALFEIDSKKVLIDEIKIIHDINNFETSKTERFSLVDTAVKTISYSGKSANLISTRDYSSTYSLNLDKLYEIGFFNTHIMAKIKLYDKKDLNAQFVISVEQNGAQVSRESISTTSFIAIDRGWKQGVIHHQIMQPLPKGTIVKIYVWNTGGKNIAVDDFEVVVYKDPRVIKFNK